MPTTRPVRQPRCGDLVEAHLPLAWARARSFALPGLLGRALGDHGGDHRERGVFLRCPSAARPSPLDPSVVACPPTLGLRGVAAFDPRGPEPPLDLPAITHATRVVHRSLLALDDEQIRAGKFWHLDRFVDLLDHQSTPTSRRLWRGYHRGYQSNLPNPYKTPFT